MMKTSMLLMLVLTVLSAMALRWREKRSAVVEPRRGWVEKQKRNANRWVTAAAIAAIVTLAVLGGLHWLRVWTG